MDSTEPNLCPRCGGGYAVVIGRPSDQPKRGARIGDGQPTVFHEAKVVSPGSIFPPDVAKRMRGREEWVVEGWHITTGDECLTIDDLKALV